MEATGQNKREFPYVSDAKIKPAVESLDRNTFDKPGPKPCPADAEDLHKKAFCRYYDECLNLAAKENWSQFTCQACGRQDFEIEIRPSAREMLGYYRLLHKVLIGKRTVESSCARNIGSNAYPPPWKSAYQSEQ